MTSPVVSISQDQQPTPSAPAPSRCAMAQTYCLEAPDIAMFKLPPHTYSQRHCPSPITSSALSSIPTSPEFADATEDQLPPTPTTLSSLSLSVSDDSDDEIILPAYDSNQLAKPNLLRSADASGHGLGPSWTTLQRLVPHTLAADDALAEEEPSRHVDYLSYEWKEEDIWKSWRYVVGRRDVYSNGARLENASWRTWAKLKHRLGTVSPETLNWFVFHQANRHGIGDHSLWPSSDLTGSSRLKDCDVTWLYGPLKSSNEAAKTSPSVSPPPSRLETPNLYLDRKPILKKRTASEAILQRSLSQHTLLQHAGAILKAQEAGLQRHRASFSRPRVGCTLDSSSANSALLSQAPTNLSSGLVSPCEKRRIHFNNEVVQCIAVEIKDVDEGEENWLASWEENISSDDGTVLCEENSSQEFARKRNTLRSSSNTENKIIAPLPSTTLKYRGDTPEPPSGSMMGRWSGYFSKSTILSSSSTFSEPSPNFLLDGWDDDHSDLDRQPGQLEAARDGSRPWFVNPEDEEELDRPLHSNSSNPGLGDDERDSASASIFDRVIDTVNTARDIAHVIWNVGWRR
ncbi:protein phosphatase regulator REG1 [Aspergillus clavatus NRRL 1]|uniref:Protein phosphatase type 1 complex subunit Hex2/Reg1, putative n=1 Tax=Aspergillus clavatus (strain ATCC 1007 / CBS 513.65 / DSM 816 / NCTC 3887 / NRRL 1 / QM 1276 / 107) TaxID=344612 RepID=A1C8E4_ASPCL|nr:protein phosphatase type 1 complex subunit Hex2/Reg1, putative [Aspergillus clavatus NRRL 1]EAW13581.1 protein phosphatase type 1 complex subunit Hex2/Reg1, putative [Aspergillus clavatus NRRL 1]